MFRPNCFGLVVAYSDSAEECRACKEKEACSSAAAQTLAVIGEEIDVSDLVYIIGRDSESRIGIQTNAFVTSMGAGRKTDVQTRFALTQEQERVVEFVKNRYQKAERLVRSMFKNGIDLRWSLGQGDNPFDRIASHKYMRVVCDKLLDSGFTRPELKREFVRRYEWGDGTAASHVLVCTHTLSALGIASEDAFGRFTLRG